MKLVMDLVVNHTSSAHAWFAESRSSTGQPQARLVLVALPAARSRARVTGVRADQLGLGVLGPGVDLRRPHRRVLPAPVRPRAARPQLGEPGGAAGGLRHDALLAGPRRRRLPDGRHQRDLEGGRPGRRRRPGRRCRTAWSAASATRAGRVSSTPSASPTRRRSCSTDLASTSSSRRCTARSSPTVRPGCSTSVRRPAARSRRRCSTPTRRAASWTWCSSSSTSTSTPARGGSGTSGRSRCSSSSSRSGAGRTAWPRSGGTASTSETTTSRAASAGSAPTHRSTGSSPRRRWPPCCTCTAARRTSTRATSSG